MITVNLTTAMICFAQSCYPALVGHATPVGTYDLNLRLTASQGYGGDVIQYHEDSQQVYAIHRLWLLKPEQKRQQKIHSSNPAERYITAGCINLEPEVYDKLKNCCLSEKLVIER